MVRRIGSGSFGFFAVNGRAVCGRFVWASSLASLLGRLVTANRLSDTARASALLLEGLRGERSLVQSIALFNRLCIGGFRLLWVGSFDELCVSNHDFARCVRGWLRAYYPDSDLASDCLPLSSVEAERLSYFAPMYRLGQQSHLAELFV